MTLQVSFRVAVGGCCEVSVLVFAAALARELVVAHLPDHAREAQVESRRSYGA